MLCTGQVSNSFNSEEVAPDALDVCTHSFQHFAQLLNVWFTGCIINSCSAPGHNSRHDNVGCSCHRRLIKQQVSAMQVTSLNVKESIFRMINKFGAQLLETKDVSVEPSSADLISARLWNKSFTEPR